MGAVQACKCNCNKKAHNEEVQLVDVDEPLINNNLNNTDVVCRQKNAVKLNDSEFNGDQTPPESSWRDKEVLENNVDIVVEIKDKKRY
jgi:hypothetical protein